MSVKMSFFLYQSYISGNVADYVGRDNALTSCEAAKFRFRKVRFLNEAVLNLFRSFRKSAQTKATLSNCKQYKKH